MKAVKVSSFGLDYLQPTDRFVSETLQNNEVLVQIKAVSLNYRDLMMIRGEYNPRQSLPLIPCSDGVGEVLSTGSSVLDFKPGDRVAGLFAQDWISGPPCKSHFKSTLGGPLDGVLCEQRIFPASGLIKIPDYLSDEEASTLPCAALTAWRALFVEANTQPGDMVLLQGTGGVSLFALQFAKLAGARVIILSSSDEKLDKAKSLGADQLINYSKTPNWSAGLQVDLVLDVGGAGTLSESLKAVKHSGQINLIGRLEGGATQIDLVSVFMRHIRLQGVFVGNQEDFAAMNRALELHKVRPVIDSVFSLEESRQAFLHLQSAKHIGKVVVKL